MSTATANPWRKKATSREGDGDYELPPGGTYPGCMVGLIDIGTHANDKGKHIHKILLVFELTGEHDSKGQTFKVMREFNFSLNSKSHLRAFLEGWDGAKLKDDEEYDVLSYLLRDGVINITEGISGNNKKYIDVASITKPFRGLVVPPRTVEPFVFSLDTLTSTQDLPPIPGWVPRNFGRTVADEIKASHEWGELSSF